MFFFYISTVKSMRNIVCNLNAFIGSLLLIDNYVCMWLQSSAYKEVEDALRARRFVSSPATRAKRTTDHIITGKVQYFKVPLNNFTTSCICYYQEILINSLCYTHDYL